MCIYIYAYISHKRAYIFGTIFNFSGLGVLVIGGGKGNQTAIKHKSGVHVGVSEKPRAQM